MGGLRNKRTSDESHLILELDQHNNSSIALSPRTAPRRHRVRSRKAYNDSNFSNGDASATTSGAAALGTLPSGTTAQTSARRRIVSTPIQRQQFRRDKRVITDPSFASASTASTSGILGPNGSFVNHTSSSPPQNSHSYLQGESNATHETIGETDEEEEEYYSDSTSGEVSWELVDRLRVWRNDALNQHLYSTAIFWGSKVFTKTRNPNDGFWLAQAYFAAGLYSRAERVLVGGWQVEVDEEDEHAEQAKDKGKQPEFRGEDMTIDEDDAPAHHSDEPRSSATERAQALPNAPRTAASQASTLKGNNAARKGHITFGKLPDPKEVHDHITGKKTKQLRLTDISVACRYLAAQAMVRQEKWSAAMEMLGEVNPFRTRRAGKGRFSNAGGRETGDGGIKVSGNSCVALHFKGRILSFHYRAVRGIHVPPPRLGSATSQCSRQSQRMFHGSFEYRR